MPDQDALSFLLQGGTLDRLPIVIVDEATGQARLECLEGVRLKGIVLTADKGYDGDLTLTPAQMTAHLGVEPKPLMNSDNPREIIELVCTHFGVSHADMLSKRRPRALACARHMAMHLIRQNTNLSLQEIGDHLGHRDHTTVLHGIHSIADALESDPRLATQLRSLQGEINRTPEPEEVHDVEQPKIVPESPSSSASSSGGDDAVVKTRIRPQPADPSRAALPRRSAQVPGAEGPGA